jgi:hypothetical protein
VATVDIPGAFMQADMDKLVHMRLEGTMAELLVRINPKLYRKFVQVVNGKQVLYVKLNVFKEKEMWKDQGPWLRGWSETMVLHKQRRRKLADSIN